MSFWFTEAKEKTTGRRRSTSRRKSNANSEPDPDPDPEPRQERLCPEPKLDPGTNAPQPDPTIPISSLEPAPSSEEEDRTSAVPTAAGLANSPRRAPSPEEEPQVSPPHASLSPSPSSDCGLIPSPNSSPRPAPEPVTQDRPCPIHSPIPLEVACSPSTVPMETEGGGGSLEESPMEQSPALSPCSSPPVSPCPRLVDEDSLSPLFQRSLSEDSGGSPTPSLGHTKKR